MAPIHRRDDARPVVFAASRWAWWNQYGSGPIDACVERVRRARLDGVIVKWGYTSAREAFARAGVAWATERYVYPHQPETEARRLADDIAAGARFAVVNAEVEWEALDATPMRRLVAEFRRLQPRAELYACVDTRGKRTSLPYQRVLAEHIAGWMPMVYPGAFGQSVRDAFASALDGKPFDNKPVLPAIQTYGAIGASMVREQIEEVRRRGLLGYQAYTIAHASEAEWAELVRDAEVEMEAIDKLRRLQSVSALFLRAAGHALLGEPLPGELRAQLRFLLG
ncbi:MAG: hypothetical protein WEB04_02405 [Dehalococcoidia bacterium]